MDLYTKSKYVKYGPFDLLKVCKLIQSMYRMDLYTKENYVMDRPL